MARLIKLSDKWALTLEPGFIWVVDHATGKQGIWGGKNRKLVELAKK